ncbi:PTS sugar transporter subunit IIA [bacterium]|nr:PTS sugar transporter subunit IIA [bacterium]
MRIYRLLDPELIELDFDKILMEAYKEVLPDHFEEINISEILLKDRKEVILWALVKLMSRSGNVQNMSKLLKDLIFREKKASTAIGTNIAIPHIRTMQAKDFIIGFARYEPGIDFDAIDQEPVKLFFPMVAPPYEDKIYLKILKKLMDFLKFEYIRNDLMQAETVGEVIKILRLEE